jgi:hypothetical protein
VGVPEIYFYEHPVYGVGSLFLGLGGSFFPRKMVKKKGLGRFSGGSIYYDPG